MRKTNRGKGLLLPESLPAPALHFLGLLLPEEVARLLSQLLRLRGCAQSALMKKADHAPVVQRLGTKGGTKLQQVAGGSDRHGRGLELQFGSQGTVAGQQLQHVGQALRDSPPLGALPFLLLQPVSLPHPVEGGAAIFNLRGVKAETQRSRQVLLLAAVEGLK